MNIKQNYKKIIGISLIINIIVISLSVMFVLSQSSNTFTISSGIYPNMPSVVVWKEGSTYYAKNSYGVVLYSGINASIVIQNTIDNLPTKTVRIRDGSLITSRYGWIHIKANDYYISPRLLIPYGSRIRLSGENYIVHSKNWSITQETGTRLITEHNLGALRLSSGTVIATSFYMENIEFIQKEDLLNNDQPCVDLNNMKEGELKNVVITTANNTQWETGRGLSILSGGYLTDTIILNNVKIAGFDVGLRTDAVHLFSNYLTLRICRVGIYLTVASHQSFFNTHFFTNQRPIGIATGESTARTVMFQNTFLENIGNDPADLVWNGEQEGVKIILYNVHTSSCQSDLWTFKNRTNWEFHQVNIKTSPIFPEATTPSVPASTTTIINPNPSVVEVYIYGGTVTAIKIGNVTTGLTSGSFILYGRDNITLTYSSVPTWKWRAVDVLWSN